MKWWDQEPWSSSFKCWVLSHFFHSPLSPSSRDFLVPLHFLPISVICISEVVGISIGNLDFSLWVHPCQQFMWYSACKLSKQGDNIQPWRTPFPIFKQSIVPCLVLTVASCSAYRFLKRKVMWFGILTCLRIFQNLLWSTLSRPLV